MRFSVEKTRQYRSQFFPRKIPAQGLFALSSTAGKLFCVVIAASASLELSADPAREAVRKPALRLGGNLTHGGCDVSLNHRAWYTHERAIVLAGLAPGLSLRIIDHDDVCRQNVFPVTAQYAKPPNGLAGSLTAVVILTYR